jgi:hypothetical protein
MVTGDFNGDGKADVAYTNLAHNTVGVLLGNGDGTFRAAKTYGTDIWPTALLAGDFNGDGKLDLLAVSTPFNPATGTDDVRIGVLLGNGDGTFRPLPTFAAAAGVPALAVGDFNGDGKLDLVEVAHPEPAGGAGSASGSVFLGNGDGTFRAPISFAVGSWPAAVAVADFNHDGKMDLAVADAGNNTVTILSGNGNGTFAAQNTLNVSTGPYAVATADFNGDGKPDLVVAGANDAVDTVDVFLGKGDGTFQARQIYRLAVTYLDAGLVVGDLNNDGKPDILVGNEVLAGNGDGTFQSPTAFALSSTVAALADVDQDGTPDVLITESNANVYEIRNNPAGLRIAVTAPPDVTQGQPFPLTLTAEDASGTVDTDYTGTVTITLTTYDPRAVLPGSYTFTAADRGTHTFSITINTPAIQAIVVQNAADGTVVGSMQVTVNAAPPPLPPPIPPLPPAAPISLTAVGAGAGGGPEVKVYNANGTLRFDFLAYAPGFTGGVRVAVGDVNGDGVPDIITAPGPGGGPDIHVYDGQTGRLIRQFWAFDPRFTGGAYVAAADVNRDGFADIIAGADTGGGPNVAIYSGKDGALLASFFAYGRAFTGGVRVAAGDVTGDGHADIIAGAGAGGGPDVAVFRGSGALVSSFFAFDRNFTGGVFVSTRNMGGGPAAMVTGAGAGGGPDVAQFRADGTLLNSAFAFAPAFTGGVRVSAGGSGTPLLASAGAGGAPEVHAMSTASPGQIDDFFAFDSRFTGGLFVACGP